MRNESGKRGQASGGWLAICLFGICMAAIGILLLQLRTMTSGELGGSVEDGDSRRGQTGKPYAGTAEANGLPLICVDAGHGYDDPGATHANLNGLDEKDITLDIALRLTELLREKGYPVMMTRPSDDVPGNAPDSLKPDNRGLIVLDPYERCDIANAENASLFISVHCNSLPSSSSVRGMQLYYTEAHTPDNADYADVMADSLEEAFGDRPKITANPENDSYVVNRLVEAPSVLVETGFITNAEDAKLMLSEEWKQQMAQALADGICAFLED